MGSITGASGAGVSSSQPPRRLRVAFGLGRRPLLEERLPPDRDRRLDGIACGLRRAPLAGAVFCRGLRDRRLGDLDLGRAFGNA